MIFLFHFIRRIAEWVQWSFHSHNFLQCFDTVGCVIWPVPVPDMTYNVFGGTLNLAQLNSIQSHKVKVLLNYLQSQVTFIQPTHW